MSIKQAFDSAAHNYDQARKQLIPCFDEFYKTALELIPFDAAEKFNVLDIGAGTGLFSSLVSKRYPYAEFVLYDLSDKMLDQAKNRFAGSGVKVEYEIKNYSIEKIDIKFDLIISALSIHHLTGAEKKSLFKKLFLALKPEGMFVNADQVLGETPYEEATYMSSWLKSVKQSGADQKTLEAAFERMKEDKMSTLPDQLLWLKKAGFSGVACWYKNFSFAVYSGRRD